MESMIMKMTKANCLNMKNPTSQTKLRTFPLGSARPSQDTAKTINIQGNIEKYSGNIGKIVL
jgi:hypothetical protein